MANTITYTLTEAIIATGTSISKGGVATGTLPVPVELFESEVEVTTLGGYRPIDSTDVQIVAPLFDLQAQTIFGEITLPTVRYRLVFRSSPHDPPPVPT